MQGNLYLGNLNIEQLEELNAEIVRKGIARVPENLLSPNYKNSHENKSLDPMIEHCGKKATSAAKHGEENNITPEVK